jgi:2-polyprenyl-3-methyl-5-hydroxy-6-metoxy-1,4-benzoquinol methylase
MHPDRVQVHTDFEDRHWWFVGRRRVMTRLVRRLVPPGQGRAIVDIGCGTGANIASPATDYTCFGIDPTPDAIASAEARFPSVHFVCGTAPAALKGLSPVPALVLLMDVIEHVEDDSGFLGGILEAVAPGTLVLITVPAEPALWSKHDEAFGQFRRYVPATLRALWQQHAVDELMLSSFNHYLYPVVRVARALNRLRGTTSGAADTDFSMPPGPLNRLLASIFAAEGVRLEEVVAGSPRGPFTSGVSLLAVLRKSGPSGEVET